MEELESEKPNQLVIKAREIHVPPLIDGDARPMNNTLIDSGARSLLDLRKSVEDRPAGSPERNTSNSNVPPATPPATGIGGQTYPVDAHLNRVLDRRVVVRGIFPQYLIPNFVGIFHKTDKFENWELRSPSSRQTRNPRAVTEYPESRYGFPYKALNPWPSILTSSSLRTRLTAQVVGKYSSPRQFPDAVNNFCSPLLPRMPQLLALPSSAYSFRQGLGMPPSNSSLAPRPEQRPLKGTNVPEPMQEVVNNTFLLPSASQVITMAHVSADQVVQFSMEEVQMTKYRAAHSLLGRLFTVNRISTTELQESVIAP
ncbi:unnamed protein product [Linum trigynum]|uniref:Uncharacterized protein n=1 Tax=Linum trigynum TaxID=586398 RepID=A0AAV2CBZ0_9ROSI